MTLNAMSLAGRPASTGSLGDPNPAVTVSLRKALYGLRALVLLNGAALRAEQALLPLCNNRVIAGTNAHLERAPHAA